MIAILSQIFASLCKIDRKSPEEDNDWLQQPAAATSRQVDWYNIQILNMDLDIDIYYKRCKKLSLFNTR